MVKSGWKWMKLDENGLKWMEMTKMVKIAHMAKMAKMVKNGWKWMKMAEKY